MTHTIHIVVATDSNYLIHTQTLLKSIEDNHKGHVTVHVLAFKLNDEEKSNLRDTVVAYEYRFYDMDDQYIKETLFAGCSQLHQDRSLAAFARLLIPKLLDVNIKRCIYMDVDAITLDSLSELYDLPIEDYAIAGVLDTNPQQRHASVGLAPENSYINTGLILWNLDYCRKTQVVNRFADFIREHNGVVDAMDQGTINGTLSKETLNIAPKFNVLTSFFQMNARQIVELYGVMTYSDTELSEAKVNPVFIHYTPNMTTRPWVKNCKHPLKAEYWKYRLAVNPEFHLAEDNRAIKMRVLSWMFYHLSWKLYLTIVSSPKNKLRHQGGVFD